jgi:hypothetical protein
MKTFRQTFLETRYIGPTNHKPARIKVINVTSGKSRTLTYANLEAKSNMDAHEVAARVFLSSEELYQGDLLSCGTKRGYMFTAK